MLCHATTWRAVAVPVELTQLLSRGQLYLVHHRGVSAYLAEEEVIRVLQLPVSEATLGELVLEVCGATLAPRRLTPEERAVFLQFRRYAEPESPLAR